MCVVSMIGDHFGRTWPERHQWIQPITQPATAPIVIPPSVTKAEFEQLKAEVEILKGLLRAAKKYDEENGEPDCEMDEKMALLRAVAKAVGVDLDAV